MLPAPRYKSLIAHPKSERESKQDREKQRQTAQRVGIQLLLNYVWQKLAKMAKDKMCMVAIAQKAVAYF